MTTRALLRRVRPAAPAADLNGTLSNLALMLAGGLTWANMAAQVVERDFTMPSNVYTPTLAGLWLPLATPEATKDSGGRVWLSGQATGGTYGTTPLFALPQEYRPAKVVSRTVAQSSNMAPDGLVTINPDGSVVAPVVVAVQTGTSQGLSFDGISFLAADPTPVLPGVPFPLVVVPQGLQGPPRSVIPLSCLDITRNPVAVAPPALAWDVSVVGGRPVFRVLNAVGCFPGRSYRLRFVVLAF